VASRQTSFRQLEAGHGVRVFFTTETPRHGVACISGPVEDRRSWQRGQESLYFFVVSVTRCLSGETSALEAVVGVDAEAQDRRDLNRRIPAFGGLEFPAAQGCDDLGRHHA